MRLHLLAVAALAALTCLLTPACASLQGAPSLNDQGQSPRQTTVAGIGTVTDVLDKLTSAAKAGVLPDNFADDVGQYQEDVRAVAVGYLDATEACVVIDGALQTDPSTGRVCERSEVKRAFGDVSALVYKAIDLAGPKTDTGRGLLIAWLFLERVLKPSSGDVWSGYAKGEDLTREDFNAARAALKVSFDAFVAAAATAAKPR